MRAQALQNETPIYYHTQWQCVSMDTVQGDHSGNEPGVRVEEGVSVPWAQVFLTEAEAEADLKRTTKYKGTQK